jgi:uncharacterized membrane protein
MPTKITTEICGLRELFNEKFNQNSKDHELILEQTTKTNGSVRVLQQWRSFMLGGMTIISMFLIPIIIYLAANIRKDMDDIKHQIVGCGAIK